ncbi:MAG TPA: alpha/beta fold hydrolase [Anaerolineales bacterium]
MIWWVLAFAIAIFGIWILLPVSIGKLESHPQPVSSFEEAMICIREMQDVDDRDLARDVCITKLFDHGRQTEHAIVLLHGFTTCPEQFNELGKQFFQNGHNVFIPRMPYHGLSDRLTDALVHLTAESLTACGDEVLNIAHGLGRKITVMGLSGSGTLVAWLAQNRADLDFAFAIAPLFGLALIPSAFTRLFERLALHLPNFYLWWDPRTKADNPYSIYYAYPGYPVRALVEIIRLAMITRSQAEHSPPRAGYITMILNDAEPAVSNTEILRLLKLWRRNAQGTLSEVHFEQDMRLPHDILTPGTPGLPIADIYPRLIGAVSRIHAMH